MPGDNYIERLKERIGITWESDLLLEEALTHKSYAYENKGKISTGDNERLEFLGDAVLELIVSEYLYLTCMDKSEGELTKMRARIVCEPSLATVAEKIGLGECLYMGRGEERAGGRKRPSILADAFESVLGAVYLDKGYDVAKYFALNELSGVISGVLNGDFEKDYKTELQEYLQKRAGDSAQYQIIQEEGPDHNKLFTVAVNHRGKMLGKGRGHSKKGAEQEAARAALENITKE